MIVGIIRSSGDVHCSCCLCGFGCFRVCFLELTIIIHRN